MTMSDLPDQPDPTDDEGALDQPVADPDAVPKADEDAPGAVPDPSGSDDEETVVRPVDEANPE